MLKRTLYPLLLALAAAWLATPADAFQQRLYRRAEAAPSGDANCLLLCHFDGTDAATTTTDSSLSAHTITLSGDAQLDTAQKQFGTASLLLDGSGDYGEAADSADWEFGAGDFTLEAWVRFASTGERALLAQRPDSSNHWQLYTRSTPDIVFNVRSGGTKILEVIAGWTPSTATWYHVAVVRQSGVIAIYIDGSALTLATNTSPSATLPDFGAPLNVGILSTIYPFDGHLDEVRVSKVARYTSNFTPAGPFDP
jgi:hypothetical protein